MCVDHDCVDVDRGCLDVNHGCVWIMDVWLCGCGSWMCGCGVAQHSSTSVMFVRRGTREMLEWCC